MSDRGMDEHGDMPYEAYEDEPEGGPSPAMAAINITLIVLAQAVILGTYYAVTSPIWVPIAAYQKIKSIVKPEPKPVYRGTVRPMVPIAETARPRKEDPTR